MVMREIRNTFKVNYELTDSPSVASSHLSSQNPSTKPHIPSEASGYLATIL